MHGIKMRGYKMKKNLISVIIPAFQAEQYLERCVESVCAQSYREIEILLVCTQSEDGTEGLCRELADRDQRITLLWCPGKGVSRARNIALERAQGEYLAFVDADDYVEQNFLNIMYEKIQGREISVCGFDRVKAAGEPGEEETRRELLGEDRVYERDALLTDILCNNTVGGYLWNKLFRGDIVRKAALRFRTDLTVGEDMVFLAEYMKYVQSGYYRNEIAYHYCFNGSSALQKMYTTGVFEESKLSNRKASRYIQQSFGQDSQAVREAVSYRMVRTGMWTLFNLLKCDHFDREILRDIQTDMNGNVLGYCKNPNAKTLEKAAAVCVRVWPEGFWRVARMLIRVAPEGMVRRYVN